MKKLFAAALFSLLAPAAHAGCSIGAYPFILQDGTVASASQVMADFNQVTTGTGTNCAGAGTNNDITALGALATPLNPAQGGTQTYSGGTSTGSANAQVVSSLIPSIGFLLSQNYCVNFTAGFTNTGPTQLNVFSTGLTNIFKRTSSGPVAMIGGEIQIGTLVNACFDGTQYELMNNLVPVFPASIPHAFLNAQRFTVTGAGTYTPTPGTGAIRIRMCGGGGSSEDSNATLAGLPGSTTSFLGWTAHGGQGASAAAGPGAGGTGGTNGSGILVQRTQGNGGSYSSTGVSATPAPGNGGAGFFGGSPVGPTGAPPLPGVAAQANSCAGGTGGFGASAIALPGGAGEYVEFWIIAPVSGSLSVGPGGTAPGSGSTLGGNGASGVILVDEYQ